MPSPGWSPPWGRRHADPVAWRSHPRGGRTGGRPQGDRLARRRRADGPPGRPLVRRPVRVQESERRQAQDPRLDGRRVRPLPPPARTWDLRLPDRDRRQRASDPDATGHDPRRPRLDEGPTAALSVTVLRPWASSNVPVLVAW